jgi:hypothetical protein
MIETIPGSVARLPDGFGIALTENPDVAARAKFVPIWSPPRSETVSDLL